MNSNSVLWSAYAPLHVASPGHSINMLSLPSSTTLMKGLNNTRAGTDPCRTILGPRSLTDTLNPVIKVSPTLGFPAHYEHVVESSTKSLTQLKPSSLFKDWATIVIKLLSIWTSKFVKVVLPEANCCYFALLPSFFPPKKPLLYHFTVILHQVAFCHLHQNTGPKNLLASLMLSWIHLPAEDTVKQKPTCLILYFRQG